MDMTGYTSVDVKFLDLRTTLGAFPGQDGRFLVVWDAIAQPAGGRGYLCQRLDDRVFPIAWISQDYALWSCRAPLEIPPVTAPVLRLVGGGEVEWRDPASGATRTACHFIETGKGRVLLADHREDFGSHGTLEHDPRDLLALCYLVFIHGKQAQRSLKDTLRETPLPDAIDALIWRVDNPPPGQVPVGQESYAARLFRNADVGRLRELMVRTHLATRYLESPGRWWFVFDSDEVTAEERSFLYRIEDICNRLVRIGDVLAERGQSDASEGFCSEIDWMLDAAVASAAPSMMSSSTVENAHRTIGEGVGKPGGLWDTQTRFGALTESIRSSYRLVAVMDVNLDDGVMAIDYTVADLVGYPPTRWHRPSNSWFDVRSQAPLAQMQDAVRLGVLIAAAGFGSALAVRRVQVNARPRSLQAKPILSMAFERPAFYNLTLPAIKEDSFLDWELTVGFDRFMQMIRPAEVRARLTSANGLTEVQPLGFRARFRYAKMVDDQRPLPADMRELFRADTFGELDSSRTLDSDDWDRVESAFNDLPEAPLLAIAMAEDVAAKYADWNPGGRPALYWKDLASRALISTKRSNPDERFACYPLALARAHIVLTKAYRLMGEGERALEHARVLMTCGPTEPVGFIEAGVICNQLERYSEAVEYLREAASVSLFGYECDAALYQLAMALDGLGQAREALACLQYIEAEPDEIRAVMHKIGREEPLSQSETYDVLRRAGIPTPITRQAAGLVQRAAVGLADGGSCRPAGSIVLNTTVLFRSAACQAAANSMWTRINDDQIPTGQPPVGI